MNKKKFLTATMLLLVALQYTAAQTMAETLGIGWYSDFNNAITGGYEYDGVYFTQGINNGGGYDLIVLDKDEFTIDGQGYFLKGNEKAGVVVNSGHSLTVRNIGNLTSIDSNTPNGIYNYSVGANKNELAKTGSAIINNGGNVTIENTLFLTPNSNTKGGGIDNNGTMSITGSVFSHLTKTSNTYANNGGAIRNRSNGTISLLDADFENNKVSGDGAAIYDGGGIITKITSRFKNNTAARGGAIMNFGQIGTIEASEYTSNIASGKGGAIYNHGTIGEISSDTTFTSNSSTDNGGAILNDANIVSSNATFTTNIASGNGGAIANESGSIGTLSGIFRQNAASSGFGGAVYNNADITSISSASFEGNTASIGGALFNQSAIGTISGTFTSNSSNSGGAIYNYKVSPSVDTKINSINATFLTNHATIGSGGAISNDAQIGSIAGNFQNNDAQIKGGAIENGSNGIISDVSANFYGNKTIATDGNGQGGAIYNEIDGSVSVSGGIYNSNTSDRGGAIYNRGALTFDTSDNSVVFRGNSASIAGDDIYMQSVSSAKVATVTVEGDNADNMVLFDSQNAIAGSGVFTNASDGMVAFVGNTKVNNFTGSYIQNGAGSTVLSGSNMFNNFSVSAGALAAIDGSSVTFENDTWNENAVVYIEDSSLLINSTKNDTQGILQAYSGDVTTADGVDLTVRGYGYIYEATDVDVNGNLSVLGSGKLSKGIVELSSGDHIAGDINIDNYGEVYMSTDAVVDGDNITFNGDNARMNLGISSDYDFDKNISGSAGTLEKVGNGAFTFTGTTKGFAGSFVDTYVGDITVTDEDGFGGSIVLSNTGSDEVLVKTNTIDGQLKVVKGLVNVETLTDVDLSIGSVDVDDNSIVNVSTTGDKDVTIIGDVAVKNNSVLNISGQKVNINGDVTLVDSEMFVNSEDFTLDNLTLGGVTDTYLMNDEITSTPLGSLTLSDGSLNRYTIDIAPRNKTSDQLVADSISATGDATINISDFNLVGKDPIDRHIDLKIFTADSGDLSNIKFTTAEKTFNTPIGKYSLFSKGQGNYRLSLTEYNPKVFRGQVATVASWQNQLVIDDILFEHAQQLNILGANPNTQASTLPQTAPYQYSRGDSGLWYKGFGTFEKLSMTQGLRVGNNFYGSMVGADLPEVKLSNGWSMVPTAFIAYTGGHQYYSGVSMYQNGGEGGAMATFFKDDFIGSVLAYGGGYGNHMSVEGNSDNTGNWFAGTAVKAAYNYHATDSFILQPTLLTSYNIYGSQNWNTQFGAMNMQSGMLNGINVAPGLNMIYKKDTWSLYTTVQYFYNIMGYADGRAGNVDLPNVRMEHGFLQYGFGATKSWKDRFSSYAQFVIRNAGRTGVGCQFGLMFRL